MRVSAKSDYALRALIEMASRQDGRAVSAEELGRRQDIPHGFLQAILADLRRAGIVMSQRGQSGGWRMGRPATDVSVADVIRAVDGPLVSVYGLRPEAVSYNETADVLQHVWIAARRSRFSSSWSWLANSAITMPCLLIRPISVTRPTCV